jgi:hypothetical protein
MKIPDLVRASVVGVTALGGPNKKSESIWTMPGTLERPVTPETLGVITGGVILTCAHIQPAYGMLPLEVDLFCAWCLNDPELPTGCFGALYASSLGYLALAPDTFTVEMSEAGGTESGLGLLIDHRDKWADGLRLAKLEFPEGCNSTKVWGYYFAADGQSVERAKFRLHRGSHKIDFYSNGIRPGTSGSPIFTEDHKLIGFVGASMTMPDLNGLPHCLGCRFDLGLPAVLHGYVEWEEVSLAAESPEAANDPEDPWNRQEREMQKLLGETE